VQKFAKLSIIQPGIARFRSNFVDFDHMTLAVPRTFKVNVSKVKVTVWHNVSASQKRYNSGTDKLSKVKLGEN